METLILAWYVLVSTGSVLLLTVFASLNYIGTLLAPLFGVIGHRIGERNLLCAMRAFYATLAAALTACALAGALAPPQVFIFATLIGIVRPSDLAIRFTVIGNTVPPAQLMGGMSISRTTQDSARIMGALTGAGVFAMLGMGTALSAITILYATSAALTLRVSGARPGSVPAGAETPQSHWRDLRDAIMHVRRTPRLLGTMILAFLFNVTAFPMVIGLLPYVAKQIYATDQTGLGYLVASFAAGSLLGTLVLIRIGNALRPARAMLVCCVLWHAANGVFSQMPTLAGGITVLVLAGLAQSLCTIPLSVMLLRTTDERFRGRIMGVRILAVYGLPLGLMLAGELITHIGYRATSLLYSSVGILCVAWISLHWRDHLWQRNAPANRR
jgi:MFS family permease